MTATKKVKNYLLKLYILLEGTYLWSLVKNSKISWKIRKFEFKHIFYDAAIFISFLFFIKCYRQQKRKLKILHWRFQPESILGSIFYDNFDKNIIIRMSTKDQMATRWSWLTPLLHTKTYHQMTRSNITNTSLMKRTLSASPKSLLKKLFQLKPKRRVPRSNCISAFVFMNK